MSNAEIKVGYGATARCWLGNHCIFEHLHFGWLYALRPGRSSVAGVLSQWDVSKAYPLVGLGFVFTVAIGWFIGEQVTSLRAIGVAYLHRRRPRGTELNMKPSIKWTSQSETFWLATIVFIALFMRVGAIAVLDHTPEATKLAYMSMALNLVQEGYC